MIKLGQAIGFDKIMEGGTSRPWLIRAIVEGKVDFYVVKLYDRKYNEQENVVAKECICSHLAHYFDLNTPDYALIEFDKAFIDSLPKEISKTLSNKDPRLKFATRYVEGSKENYSPSLEKKYLKKYDLPTVFAFDHLILQTDRRRHKPNLWFMQEDIWLIDHEATFATCSNAIEELRSNTTWSYFYTNHLFYGVLKSLSKREKKHCFDTFEEYFRTFDPIRALGKMDQQLAEHGVPIDGFVKIADYFRSLKQFPDRFLNAIKGSIQ